MNIDFSPKPQFANARLIAAFAANCIVLVAANSLTSAQAQDRPALVHGDQIETQLATLPERSLKGHYLRCSYGANQGLLGPGEILICSIVYETLLKRSFGGNFDEFLAWSKTQRDDAYEEWFKDSRSGR